MKPHRKSRRVVTPSQLLTHLDDRLLEAERIEMRVRQLQHEATIFLRRHGVRGKSDYVLQAASSFEDITKRCDSMGRIDSDANFNTCQFDPDIGRGTDPIADEGSNRSGAAYDEYSGPEENEAQFSGPRITNDLDNTPSDTQSGSLRSSLSLGAVPIAIVFQSFGVKDASSDESTGVSVGVISRLVRPRLVTRQNWWVFSSQTFRLFLRELSKGRRNGKRVAVKAAVALHQFFYFHASDADIFRKHRKLFKTVAAVKTFREGIFKKGCSRFGEIQDPFGPWKGRHNDPAWTQFREELEQKKQQRLEGGKATSGAIDIEEPETDLPRRVPVSQEDEECVLSL